MKKTLVFLMALFLLSGHYAKAQFNGDGTDENPYTIGTATELATLAASVNSGTDYTGVHFSLIAEIDLSGVANWTPIGDGSNTFKGVFHGDYHTISNVTASGTTDVGLFGSVSGATIENLYVINVNISGTGARKGGIIGNAAAGSVVRNCYVSGNVSGAGNNGGLIGESYAAVSNCFSAVNVSGDDTQGGLIGYHRNGASITNSYSTGNVTGKNHVSGVAGYARNGGSVTYCYSVGSISGTGSASNGVGGIVGTVRDAGWSITNNVAINPSIVSTNVAAAGRVLGVNNGATGLILNNNYALQTILVNNATVTGNINDNNGGDKEVGDFRTISMFNTSGNWLDNAWDIDAIANNGKIWSIWEGKSYPYLQIQSAPVATVTSQANGILAYELRNNTEKVIVTAENGTVLKTETSVTAGVKTVSLPGLTNNTTVIFTVYETGKMPSIPVKTIYSYFLNSHTVSFAGEGISIASQSVEDGDKATEPATPVREGYIFDGWYNGNALWDFNTPVTSDLTLTAHWIANVSGDGSLGSPYIISDATALTTLATDVNSGILYSGKHFKLTADIDLSSVSNWTPIGSGTDGNHSFKGYFHGEGYRITNVSITGAADLGLFGSISGATIDNLSVTNAYIMGTGSRKGILAGTALAGSVISNCHVSGSVLGAGNNGGLVGESYASVSNCYSAANVSGDATIGGLIGYHRNGATIANCYSTGNVSGTSHVGGVVGYARNGGSITYCYSTGNITGVGAANDGVGGIAGTVRDNGWTIQNNIALNASVNSTFEGIAGRILGKNNGATDLALDNNYALATMAVNGETVTGNTSDSNGADKNAADFQASAWFTNASNWSVEAWSLDVAVNANKSWAIWNEKSYPYLQIQSAPAAVATTSTNAYELRNNAEKVVITSENGTVLKTETSVTAGVKTLNINELADNTPIIYTVYETGKLPSYPVKAVYRQGTSIINIGNVANTGVLHLYPSLVEESLTVVCNNELASNTIGIYDSTGRLLRTYTANFGETVLNLSSLTSGHYILKTGNSTARFVKK